MITFVMVPMGQSSYIEHGDSNPVFGPIDNLWGKSCRFSPLWSTGPGGNPIGPSTLLRMVSLPFECLRAGLRVSLSRTLSLSNRSNHFVPASRGGVYIECKCRMQLEQSRTNNDSEEVKK
jgi:hypothetical protein